MKCKRGEELTNPYLSLLWERAKASPPRSSKRLVLWCIYYFISFVLGRYCVQMCVWIPFFRLHFTFFLEVGFLIGLELPKLARLVGPTSLSDLPASAYPALGLQSYPIIPCSFICILGIKLRSSCSQGLL